MSEPITGGSVQRFLRVDALLHVDPPRGAEAMFGHNHFQLVWNQLKSTDHGSEGLELMFPVTDKIPPSVDHGLMRWFINPDDFIPRMRPARDTNPPSLREVSLMLLPVDPDNLRQAVTGYCLTTGVMPDQWSRCPIPEALAWPDDHSAFAWEEQGSDQIHVLHQNPFTMGWMVSRVVEDPYVPSTTRQLLDMVEPELERFWRDACKVRYTERDDSWYRQFQGEETLVKEASNDGS